MKIYASFMFLCRSLFRYSFFLAAGSVTYGAWTVKVTNQVHSLKRIQVQLLEDRGDGQVIYWSQDTLLYPLATASFTTANFTEGSTSRQLLVMSVVSGDYTVQGNSFVAAPGLPEPVYVQVASLSTASETGTWNVDYTLDETTASPVETPESLKTLWKVPDTALTADLFREGVDKIVAGSYSAGSTAGSDDGGSGGSKTEQLSDLVLDTYTNPQNIASNAAFNLSRLDAEALRESAKEEISALLPSATSSIDHSAPSGGSAAFLTITEPFTGRQVNFNPFTEARFLGIATWFRYATQWLALMLLGLWVFNEFKHFIFALSTARQASGNPVVGGTGAQGTALLNAGLITASVVVAITALLAFSFNGLNIPSLLTNAGTNPLLGFAANSYWFLDQVFPLTTILACFVARFMFLVAGNAIFGTFFTVVRFFVA